MADKKTGEEEELEIVGEGAEDLEEGKEGEKKEAKSKEKDDEDEPGEEGEEEEERAIGHSESDDEEKPKNKSSRRQREKASRARDKKEIEFLRIRNQQLEERFGEVETRIATNEVAAIDQRIQALQSQITMADEVMAQSIDQKQGKDHAEALRIRERLVKNLERLQEAKAQVEQGLESDGDEERPARQQQQKIPTEVIVNARVWRKENPWWTPGGKDKDSREVSRIDTQVAKAGYDPTSDDYWEELTKRVRKALPHRFEDNDDQEDDDQEEERRPAAKRRNGGGPRFSTGGREGSLKPNQVHISAERKAAMIEAGVWEDAKLRARYLKSFQKYDRDQAGRNS